VPSNAITIELAPTGLLQAIIKRTLATSCTNVALMSRSADDKLENTLTQLAKLYEAGLDVNVQELYAPVALPV
jgi:fatty acid synthase